MQRGENKLLQALFIILWIAMISSPYIKFQLYDKVKINGSGLRASENIHVEIKKSISQHNNLGHICLILRLFI